MSKDDVDELHRGALHLVHQVGDLGGEPVVAEVGDDAHDETAHGGEHRGVDAVAEEGDVDVVAGLGHVEEGLDHTEHGAEEADHRGAAGDGGEDRETLLEAGDLDVAGVLDGGLDVGHRTAEAVDAGFDHPGDRIVILAAKGHGRLGLARFHVVADVVHEVRVDLGGLVQGPELPSDDVDGDDRENEENPHQRSAHGEHREEAFAHLGGLGGRGRGQLLRRLRGGLDQRVCLQKVEKHICFSYRFRC